MKKTVTIAECDKLTKNTARFKIKKRRGVSGTIYVDKDAFKSKKVKVGGKYKVKLAVILVKE